MIEIQVNNLVKSFEVGKNVLDGLTFQVDQGERVGLLGRNGAGKTTAIRILMNVFPANSGQVRFNGAPIDYNKVQFGYLPEERGLYPKKKIIDQLSYFAQLKGMDRRSAVDAVDHWLERLGMTEYRNKRLDTLSKGNQQKIQLITALAHDPQVVILDEPFSGLDPVNAMLLKDVVKEEIARGKIVLFSSHQMNYIEEFCDSIAILNGGRIVLAGELHDIKRSYPRNRLVVRAQDDARLAAELGPRCARGEDGALLITLDSPAEKQTMMKHLAEQYDVDEIRVFEPSLNDIFVEYAGQQA